MRSILAIFFALHLASSAFAADTPPPSPDVDDQKTEDEAGVEEGHHRMHLPRISVAVGPAWVHVFRDNYSTAFSSNGFNQPGRDRIGFDLSAFVNTITGWQLGLGMTSVSHSQNSGAFAADYSNNLFGVYLARNLSHHEGCDFTVGTLLGGSHSELTVFSAAKNGRLRETAAVVAPSVGIASRVSRAVKLGLRVSYLVPFGESSELTGGDLGVSRIGIRGLQVALQVILGRY